MMNLYKEFGTMLRFALVGLVNTGLSAALMFLLDLTGMPYPAYTAIAYAAGIVCSFFLNRSITFRAGKKRGGMRFMRFVAATAFLLGLAQLAQFILIEKAHVPKLYGIASGMVLYTGLGYLINRLWVFAPAQGQIKDEK
jgi:putative flippase GtrA